MEKEKIEKELSKQGFEKNISGTCLTEYIKFDVTVHYWNDDIDRFWRLRCMDNWEFFTTKKEMKILLKKYL